MLTSFAMGTGDSVNVPAGSTIIVLEPGCCFDKAVYVLSRTGSAYLYTVPSGSHYTVIAATGTVYF